MYVYFYTALFFSSLLNGAAIWESTLQLRSCSLFSSLLPTDDSRQSGVEHLFSNRHSSAGHRDRVRKVAFLTFSVRKLLITHLKMAAQVADFDNGTVNVEAIRIRLVELAKERRNLTQEMIECDPIISQVPKVELLKILNPLLKTVIIWKIFIDVLIIYLSNIFKGKLVIHLNKIGRPYFQLGTVVPEKLLLHLIEEAGANGISYEFLLISRTCIPLIFNCLLGTRRFWWRVAWPSWKWPKFWKWWSTRRWSNLSLWFRSVDYGWIPN